MSAFNPVNRLACRLIPVGAYLHLFITFRRY